MVRIAASERKVISFDCVPIFVHMGKRSLDIFIFLDLWSTLR